MSGSSADRNAPVSESMSLAVRISFSRVPEVPEFSRFSSFLRGMKSVNQLAFFGAPGDRFLSS